MSLKMISIVIGIVYLIAISNAQQIQFTGGYYSGIVVGIDENKIEAANCSTIIRNIELVLLEFAKNLREATSSRAGIGVVDILIPYDWNSTHCGISKIEYASRLHSYSKSHIKITENHPLAESLPWTKQYKPCSFGGDHILLPFSFLAGSRFSDSIKGKILLHEWAKFRYGVFDEYGYDSGENEPFRPCYSEHDRQAYLNTCSSVKLPAISMNKSRCSIEFIMKNGDTTLDYMRRDSTSIMAAPYIDQSSTNYFCDHEIHNRMAANKQNFYCERKSVTEVVYSHPDFKMQGNSVIRQDPPQSLVLRYLRHEREFKTAYAFLIEISNEMRDSKKLLHAKQAIAQFLEMINRVEVQIILFSDESEILSKANMIDSDTSKRDMLNFIPEGDLKSELYNSGTYSGQLYPVIDYLFANLSAPLGYSWNIILFSSSSNNITDMEQAIRKFQDTQHSLSVISFDDGTASNSNNWLQWYEIPNTKKVIVLPYCRKSSYQDLCSLRTTSFIVQHLTSCMNDQNYDPRALQKKVHLSIQNTGGTTATFTLSQYSGITAKIYFLMTVPTDLANPADYIELISPTGSNSQCIPEVLFPGFGRVIKFSGSSCRFISGDWTLRLKSYIPPLQTNIVFDAYVEYDTTVGINQPVVVPTLGVMDLSREVQPNTNITPVYVSVMTKGGNPILDANVSIQIFHLGSLESARTIFLKDDGDFGNGADQTMNDGVYSGYLSGYSMASPSFHLCEVQVSIDNVNSKILIKIQHPNAAVLDYKMTQKCCGHKIRPLETQNVEQPFNIRTFLPGFKIMEPWTRVRLRPGQIGEIEKFNESDTNMYLQFVNVMGDVSDETVGIDSIQACCVPKSESNEFPTEADCQPDTTEIETLEPPGSTQTVMLNKKLLVDKFMPPQNDDKIEFLICQMRAVNTNSELGPISRGYIDVNVSAVVNGYVGGGRSDEKECKSIRDDCLPMWIFWTLIGSVALLLVLLILVLICCWCCNQKKEKSGKNVREEVVAVETRRSPSTLENEASVMYSKSPTPPNNTNLQRDKDEPKVVKELFVNHAYIQDGDGEIKIIADSGEILRKPLNTSIAQAPSSPPAAAPRFQQNMPSKFNQEIILRPSDNMEVFKPVPNPKPVSEPTIIKPVSKKRMNRRPEIIHANPMLRADSVQTIETSPPPVAPPVIPPLQDPALVYASISRAGRFRPPNSTSPPTNYAIINHNSKSLESPHYMVPHNNTNPKQVPFVRDPLPNFNQPAPRVQPYPSTTSDSESPLHTPLQTQRKPPRFNKPPPYPTGSQIVTRPQSSQSYFPNQRQNPTVRPDSTCPSILPPPVPPPRLERGNENQLSRSMQIFSSPRQNNLSEEDSDQWDDGDNFEYNNPGDSYA